MRTVALSFVLCAGVLLGACRGSSTTAPTGPLPPGAGSAPPTPVSPNAYHFTSPDSYVDLTFTKSSPVIPGGSAAMDQDALIWFHIKIAIPFSVVVVSVRYADTDTLDFSDAKRSVTIAGGSTYYAHVPGNLIPLPGPLNMEKDDILGYQVRAPEHLVYLYVEGTYCQPGIDSYGGIHDCQKPAWLWKPRIDWTLGGWTAQLARVFHLQAPWLA